MSLYALDNEFWEKHALLLERARFLPLLCVQRGVERCLEVVHETRRQLEELRVSRLSKQQRTAEQQRLLGVIAEERANEERLRMTGEDVYAHMTQYMHEHILAVEEVTVLCETNITTGLTQRIRRRLRRAKEGKLHTTSTTGTPNSAHQQAGAATDNANHVLHRKVQRLVAIAQELDTHCRASCSRHNANGSSRGGALTARSLAGDPANDEGQLDAATVRQVTTTLVAEGLVSSPMEGLIDERNAAHVRVLEGILLGAISLVLNTQDDAVFASEKEEDWSWQLMRWLVDPTQAAATPNRKMTPIVQMTAFTQRLRLLKALLNRRPRFALAPDVWDGLARLLGRHVKDACRFCPCQNVLTPQDVVNGYIRATLDAIACALTCMVGFEADRRQAAIRAQQLVQKLEWSLVFRCAHAHIFDAYIQVAFLSLLVAKCRVDELACCEARIRIAFWSMPALDDFQPEDGAAPPSFQLNQFRQAAHDVATIARAILRAMATHASSGVVQWHGLMALRYVLAPRQSHDQSLRVRVGVMVVEDLLSADDVTEEAGQQDQEDQELQESPQEQSQTDNDHERADAPPATAPPPPPPPPPPLSRRLSSRGPSRQNSTMGWLVDPSALDTLADYPKEMQPVSKPIQQLLPQVVTEHMHVPEVLEQWLLTTYALFRRTRVMQLWLASVGTEALTSRALLLHSRDAHLTALVRMFAEATRHR